MKKKLLWDGVDLEYLAEKYGTPLYVYSVSSMEDKIAQIKKALVDKYPKARIAYASKAFLNMAMIGLIKTQGLSLDVVSCGELQIALEAGIDAQDIEFNGNNKLPSELEYAIKNRVGRIIVDSQEELEFIEKYGRQFNYRVPVLFRVTPGINIDSHQYIITGSRDSKFGFPLDTYLPPLVERVLQSNYMAFYGFHFHLGSQLMENHTYLQALDLLFEFIDQNLEKKLIKELNIGGGFGINYLPQDQAQPFSFFFDPIIEKVNNYFKDQELPTLVTEPGRSIVGEAGLTLYKVGSIKEIPGVRNFLAVNGGMTDNIRLALYQAKYHAELINKLGKDKDTLYTVVGKCCESGDILIKDIYLPKADRNDILAVFSTGAYGYSMASNYNMLTKPAIVWVKEGQDYLVTKAQTIEQIYQNDLPYPLYRVARKLDN